MNKKFMKISATSLAILMATSNVAMAAPGDVHLKTGGLFKTKQEMAISLALQKQVTINPGQYYYEGNDGKLYNFTDVNQAWVASGKNFTSFLNTILPTKTPEGNVATETLKVESVSAISETTINVKLNKAPDAPLTSAFFTVTGATVTSVAQGVSADVYILTINSLNGQSGTVTVNGVSKTYDFTAVSQKATVQSVNLDNYRQLTVKFTAPVDAETAVDTKNYYFEIVDGNAGKLGAVGDVTSSYRFFDVDTTGSTDGIEVSQKLNGTAVAGTLTGKTVNEVTFNFPHTARFGAAPTDGGAILKILDLAGTTTDKTLSENVNVNIAVRNVKDVALQRSLDTVVKQITVTDTKAPQLLSVKDEDGNVVDITKPVTLYNTATQKLVFEFDEPIGVTAAGNQLPLNSKVFVDGNDITATSTELVGEFDKYADSRKVTLNLAAMATKAGVSYNSGDQYTVRLTGFRDLAGNLFTSNLQFNLKLAQKPSEAQVIPQILGVQQIADNVFRVEANRADVTGILTLKEAAGDGSDLEVVMPLTKLVTLDDGTKKYYSYVAVQAQHDATAANILDYKGSAYVYSDVTVNSIGALASNAAGFGDIAITSKGSDFNAGNMKIEKDMRGPVYTTTTESVDFATATDKLVLTIQDQVPTTWGTVDKAETGWYAIRNGVIANTTGAYEGVGRLSVSYTKQDGTPVTKFADLTFKNTGGANDAMNNLKVNADGNAIVLAHAAGENTLTFDLGKLISAASLDAEFLVGGKLPQNATYTLQLPESLLSDRIAKEVANMKTDGVALTPIMGSYVIPVQAGDDGGTDATIKTAAEYRASYAANKVNGLDDLDAVSAANTGNDIYALADVDTSVRIATRGFSTEGTTVTFNVGADSAVVADGVPQTSKEGISYLAATNELKVLLTGAPTVASMRDLNNYMLNGQTLAELGATVADVTIGDTTDKINGTAATKVVLIKVPAGSIQAVGPANVTVRNIENAATGKMTPVEVVVDGFKDNTPAQYISGSKAAANVLRLRFNENLKYASGANASSALQNIEVLINGTSVTVSSMTDLATPASTIDINVGVGEIKSTDTVVVNFKLNADNKMEIQDLADNKLEVQSITDITLQ